MRRVTFVGAALLALAAGAASEAEAQRNRRLSAVHRDDDRLLDEQARVWPDPLPVARDGDAAAELVQRARDAQAERLFARAARARRALDAIEWLELREGVTVPEVESWAREVFARYIERWTRRAIACERAYRRVALVRSARWTIEALAGVGSMYEALAERLADLPIPIAPTEPAWCTMPGGIDRLRMSSLDRTVVVFEACHATAIAMRLPTDASRRCREGLESMDPASWPAMQEIVPVELRATESRPNALAPADPR